METWNFHDYACWCIIKSHLTIPRKGMETKQEQINSKKLYYKSHLTIPRKGMETLFRFRLVYIRTNSRT